jgi:hypothetical protein
VGELRVNEKHLKLDANLPRLVRVRFIQALIRTRGAWKKEWFATSFLDEKEYPAEELVTLYARRWRIESLLRNVKIELSADVLRSKTVDGVRKEVCARLMALNIIRMIMIDAGQKHKVDPLRLSFVHTVRCILAFAPALANEPGWKLPEIYEAMLAEIASHFVRYRPGRNEPRAVRRERVHYPCLRTTRAQWRLDHVA